MTRYPYPLGGHSEYSKFMDSPEMCAASERLFDRFLADNPGFAKEVQKIYLEANGESPMPDYAKELRGIAATIEMELRHSTDFLDRETAIATLRHAAARIDLLEAIQKDRD